MTRPRPPSVHIRSRSTLQMGCCCGTPPMPGISSPGKDLAARAPAKRGLELARELADRPGATMEHVYNYAWLAVTVDPQDLRDPRSALPYAQQAVAMSHSENSMALHVLAQAYAG